MPTKTGISGGEVEGGVGTTGTVPQKSLDMLFLGSLLPSSTPRHPSMVNFLPLQILYFRREQGSNFSPLGLLLYTGHRIKSLFADIRKYQGEEESPLRHSVLLNDTKLP